MAGILIFGGTTEGRKLAEYFSDTRLNIYMSVATEYGESIINKATNIHCLSGRLTKEAMKELIEVKKFDMVIDATHPYATMVTENIRQACEECNARYIRIKRKTESIKAEEDGYIYVQNVEAAVELLKGTTGNILITTGSKELYKYTELEDFKTRCYARVLSVDSVVAECRKIGFEGRNLICMQGPFSEELNYAMLQQIEARYMVTKESGSQGGFEEKCNAAVRSNTIVIIVGRPEEPADCECFTYEQLVDELKQLKSVDKRIDNSMNCGKNNNKKITLLGIGMGSESTLTFEAKMCLQNCDVIIGAQRMVEFCKSIAGDMKTYYVCYDSKQISDYIESLNIDRAAIVIALSGDIGFCSGAKKMLPFLSQYEISFISGISTPIYFLNKIGTAWEDVILLSSHGKRVNIITKVSKHAKVFVLLGNEDEVSEICKKLIYYGLKDVKVTVGERLSYDDERIVSGAADEFVDKSFDKLSVIYIENEKVDKEVLKYGIADEEFIRGKVPMTKSEVRSIILNKLHLKRNSIVYDIGAGTGSVSIEAAKACEDGRVYAIEKKSEGIELINMNSQKFQVDNVIEVQGTAPECLENLETPTHVFIGGSGGNINIILDDIFKKNPEVEVVISAITLETVSAVLEWSKISKNSTYRMDVIEVSVARSEPVGMYHMMRGQNPVTIITINTD